MRKKKNEDLFEDETEKMVQLLVKDEKRDMWYPHEVSEIALSKLKSDYKIKGVDEMIKHYGEKEAMVICMEELAELSKVISKAYRYGSSNVESDFLEEIADVIICLDILFEMVNVRRTDVDEMVKKKMIRNLKRIDEEKNGSQESMF